MIAIIGATGNTGAAAAESLLAAGEKVRVIGRTAEKLQPFVAKGAEPFVGNVIDADAMTNALRGATSAYIMIPTDPKQKDLRAYDTVVIDCLTLWTANVYPMDSRVTVYAHMKSVNYVQFPTDSRAKCARSAIRASTSLLK